jgi:hypothetical protein
MALAAPEIPLAARALALAILAAALWQPAHALLAVLALTPAASLLAPAPARGAELMAWAFLAGWLARVWRPLAPAGWPRNLTVPAGLYAACAAASWAALVIRDAAGVSIVSLPAFFLDAVPSTYLALWVPETETWTMLQTLTGVGLFLGAVAAERADRPLRRRVAWTLTASAAALSLLTLAAVLREWAAVDYGAWFLARYASGERISLHMADVNAAGSLYVLAGAAAAALARSSSPWRWLAAASLVVILPAFWLTGSRTAFVGAAAAAVIVAARRAPRLWISRRQAALAAAIMIALAVAGTLAAGQGDGGTGSAGRALRLRTQFAVTSARMFASAPVYGVGGGKYFERSPEFMPGELRALYGAENAHNYFAQTFAELGVVGGALFVWLVAATLAAGWRALAARERDAAAVGLFAGGAGYLITCLAGHPFLVAEAALPFWIAFGALGAAADPSPASTPPRGVTRAAIATLAVGLLLAGVAYARTSEMPPERGLDAWTEAADGTRFRWMAPHAVTYIPRRNGFLVLTLRPPDVPLPRPMVVETRIAGRLVDRRTLEANRWTTVEIPVRADAWVPFRRVDVRASPSWIERRPFAQRSSEVSVALTAMVRELRWEGAR